MLSPIERYEAIGETKVIGWGIHVLADKGSLANGKKQAGNKEYKAIGIAFNDQSKTIEPSTGYRQGHPNGGKMDLAE